MEYSTILKSGEDEYLNYTRTYERLKSEFLKYGKLIIAYDFDNTVYDYHQKGTTYEEVIDLIRKFEKYAYLIVFTSSTPERYGFMKKFLKDNNIPFDSINDDKPGISFVGRKVYYNILLDDRAGLLECFNLLSQLYNEVILPNET